MKHTPEPFSMPRIRFRKSDGTYDVHDGWFYSRNDGCGPVGPYGTKERAEQEEIEYFDSLYEGSDRQAIDELFGICEQLRSEREESS